MKMASTWGLLLCVCVFFFKSDFLSVEFFIPRKSLRWKFIFSMIGYRFKMYPPLIINSACNYVNNIGLVLPLPDSWLLTGLNKRTTSEKLMEAFSQFGEVIQGSFMIIHSQFRPFPFFSVHFGLLGSIKNARQYKEATLSTLLLKWSMIFQLESQQTESLDFRKALGLSDMLRLRRQSRESREWMARYTFEFSLLMLVIMHLIPHQYQCVTHFSLC